MRATSKKTVVTFDGIELKLEEHELLYLEFLSDCGFVRMIQSDVFLSNSDAMRDKSLNPSFISTLSPSSECNESIGLPVGRESVSDSLDPLLNYLSHARESVSKPSQILMLESLISLFDYFLSRRAPKSRSLRSDLLALASLGECDLDSEDLQRVSVSAADSNPTEGSSFEEVMHDLDLSNTPVKRKRKSPTITKKKIPHEKNINDQIMSTAINWHEWTLVKAPWLKENISPEKFYQGLLKIAKSVSLNESGIENLFQFVKNNDFWKENAISPMSLLNVSKNGLRKIDNILLQLKKRINSDNPFYEVESSDWVNPFE
jgi:hypothetical protein